MKKFKDLEFQKCVLWNDKLCCTTHITDDVLSYQTKAEITKIMKKVQSLKAID